MSRLLTRFAKPFEGFANAIDDGVWISLVPEAQALKRAEELETDSRGAPLERSNICHQGQYRPCGTANDRRMPGFHATRPPKSAFVVQRLIDAGAVPIGKTNLDQFATGSERNTFTLRLSVQLLQSGLS